MAQSPRRQRVLNLETTWQLGHILEEYEASEEIDSLEGHLSAESLRVQDLVEAGLRNQWWSKARRRQHLDLVT